MTDDLRAALLERIARAARAGLISAEDSEIRVADVRRAGSAEDLELIRRDLDRWQGAASASATAAAPLTEPGPETGGAAVAPPAGGRAPHARRLAAPVLLAAVFVMGVAITWVYRSMRAVLDVGGACASGGPYVSAQPCPAGTWMLGAGIPALILVAMLGSVLALAVRAPSPLLVMWGVVFGVLGWNFFDYGRRYGSAGFLVCAVVFWLMAAPAVPAVLFGGVLTDRVRGATRGTTRTLLITWAWLLAYAAVGGVGARLGWHWWSQLA